jgi:hypothetical protein
MVNNSTNINKTNNNLSPKKDLNSDGQQFHQYQQNTPQIMLVLHMQIPRYFNKICDNKV